MLRVKYCKSQRIGALIGKHVEKAVKRTKFRHKCVSSTIATTTK